MWENLTGIIGIDVLKIQVAQHVIDHIFSGFPQFSHTSFQISQFFLIPPELERDLFQRLVLHSPLFSKEVINLGSGDVGRG